MAAPVNLNRYRKQKARADKKARADENVVKFGRTKAQKQLDVAKAKAAEHHVDSHKREDQ